MEYIDRFDSHVNKVLENAYRKPALIRGIVHLLLILYAAKIAPELPNVVLKLFDNPYFKLFVFSLILWTAQFSPSTSLMISLAFMISVNLSHSRGIWEFMEDNLENFGDTADEIEGDVEHYDNVQHDEDENIEEYDNLTPAAPSETPEPTIATPAPFIAPTVNDAINGAINRVNDMVQNTPVVNGVAQSPETIIITPTVVQTSSGPAIVNPQVLISPAVVATPQGQQVIVTPDVKTIEKAPVTAPPTPTPVAPSPDTKEETEGCYPVRKVDMTQVTGLTTTNSAPFEKY